MAADPFSNRNLNGTCFNIYHVYFSDSAFYFLKESSDTGI